MAVAPLVVPQTAPAANAFDFSALAQLGRAAPQANSLASLGNVYGATANAPSTAPAPYPEGGAAPTPYAAGGGDNTKSWYDFAVKPVEQGGLGLSPAQASGVVGNLQAESGAGVPSWGPTGDAGTAHGAAQWRLDRLANLQKYAAERGLDYRSTEAQQGFMRSEYLGSERGAYDRLVGAKTPEEAAAIVNRHYERSADRSGTREANASRLMRRYGLLVGDQ
jgi:hypothetical protein